jgi:hypothetical protein
LYFCTSKASKLSTVLDIALSRFVSLVVVVCALLVDGRADPGADGSVALFDAATIWNADARLLQALLEDGRADPTARRNQALIGAAAYGRTRAVRALLKDGRADPAASDSQALCSAAGSGHNHVVHALLKDGRVDPEAVSRSRCNAASWPRIQAAVRWRRRRHWLRATGIVSVLACENEWTSLGV